LVPLSTDLAFNQLYIQLTNIAQHWDSGRYLFPGTSIIQTTGAGKSRYVTRLAEKNVFVVYLNFLSPTEDGYPSRSSIADILSGFFAIPIEEKEKKVYLKLVFQKFFVLALEKIQQGAWIPMDFINAQIGENFDPNFWDDVKNEMNAWIAQGFLDVGHLISR
jgi:hypothetical protein